MFYPTTHQEDDMSRINTNSYNDVRRPPDSPEGDKPNGKQDGDGKHDTDGKNDKKGSSRTDALIETGNMGVQIASRHGQIHGVQGQQSVSSSVNDNSDIDDQEANSSASQEEQQGGFGKFIDTLPLPRGLKEFFKRLLGLDGGNELPSESEAAKTMNDFQKKQGAGLVSIEQMKQMADTGYFTDKNGKSTMVKPEVQNSAKKFMDNNAALFKKMESATDGRFDGKLGMGDYTKALQSGKIAGAGTQVTTQPLQAQGDGQQQSGLDATSFLKQLLEGTIDTCEEDEYRPAKAMNDFQKKNGIGLVSVDQMKNMADTGYLTKKDGTSMLVSPEIQQAAKEFTKNNCALFKKLESAANGKHDGRLSIVDFGKALQDGKIAGADAHGAFSTDAPPPYTPDDAPPPYTPGDAPPAYTSDLGKPKGNDKPQENEKSGMPSPDDKRPPGDNRTAEQIINDNPVLKNLGDQKDINREGLKKQCGDWTENNPDPKSRADAAYRMAKVLNHIDTSKGAKGGDRGGKAAGDGNIEGITKDGDARHGTEAGNLKDFSEKGYSALKKDHRLDTTNDTHVKEDGSNYDNFQWAAHEAEKKLGDIPIIGGALHRIAETEGNVADALLEGAKGAAGDAANIVGFVPILGDRLRGFSESKGGLFESIADSYKAGLEGAVDLVKKGKITPIGVIEATAEGAIEQVVNNSKALSNDNLPEKGHAIHKEFDV
jgi:hypothetical protein